MAWRPEGDPRRHGAGQLREQAGWCRELGSPLYAHLLERAAVDVEAEGPAWAVLSDHLRPGRADAVALRFMAAVHRLVLTGRVPRLAAHYPSAGGESGIDGAWEAFREVVEHHAGALREMVRRPCQTNEVGRCAALAFGFFEVAATAGPRLRLLEVGASAGLNLRWDHYRYGGGGAAWGDPSSPVDLAGLWSEAPASRPSRVTIMERRGCDLQPLDPAHPEDRLSLEASVWADQVERLRRLRGAMEVATRVGATVHRASLTDWLPPRLAVSRTGAVTVVFHSIVLDYLSDDERRTLSASLADHGARATADAPLAWLRLEPIPNERAYGVTLTTWPGGRERLLARAGAHGTGVTRAG
jgi:hypothetical protein